MQRLFRATVLICALVLMTTVALGAVDASSLPTPTGYVSDLAHVVNQSEKDDLEAYSTHVEQQLGVQFAFLTIDTIGDTPIRDFALDVFRKWGVGSRKTNQGVLLVLVIKDHLSDIETGRGIEPYITDGFAGSTLRSMRPQLRDSNYGAALLTAARAMAQQIAQGKGVAFDGGAPVVDRPEPKTHGLPGPLIIVVIFLFLWLIGRGGRRGGGGGFWTGILLGNLLGGGRGWGGGGWGGGGGFGGGSGGGGGFGGFGGGDAGGGGASSNW